MKRLLLFFLLTLAAWPSFSQVSLRNETTTPLFVAIMYVREDNNFRGLESKGWFNIIPGQTVQVLNYTPKDHHFYVYGKDQKNGEPVVSSFLNNDPHGIAASVDHTNAFLIQNPDMQYQIQSNGMAGFTYLNIPTPNRKVLFSLR